MPANFDKHYSQSYASRLAMRKSLWETFEFELYTLDTLWEVFANSKTDDEVEVALEEAIRYEIILVEKIEQAADEPATLEAEPEGTIHAEPTVKSFWSRIRK